MVLVSRRRTEPAKLSQSDLHEFGVSSATHRYRERLRSGQHRQYSRLGDGEFSSSVFNLFVLILLSTSVGYRISPADVGSWKMWVLNAVIPYSGEGHSTLMFQQLVILKAVSKGFHPKQQESGCFQPIFCELLVVCW